MPKSKTTKEFQKAYKALNKEQKRAVDHIEGPVMVVAGPGTGKTQTIALRIANILQKTDTAPDSILALTFTDSGARAMQERLASLIGTPAYYCRVTTFHSFCIDVMKEHPDLFTLDPSQEPVSELDKLRLIQKLIDHHKLSVLRPIGDPYHYARAVLSAISDLKREGANAEEFEALLHIEEAFLHSSEGQELKKTESAKRVRNLAKNQDLLVLYRAYQKELISAHRFDFDDMVAGVVDMFSQNPDLLREYEERYQYLLVDEYQDTNSSQNQLLLQLASFWGEEANIFVVGDPDQSIYRFQGASIENQLSFIKHFPAASVITLAQNYRSTQLVLDAADSLISHNNLRINDVVASVNPHLVSVSGQGRRINYALLSSAIAEAVFIAEDLKKRLKQGAAPSSLAVIYRNNSDSVLLSDILAKSGIDYRVQGGRNILEDPTVKHFLKILRVIAEMRSKEDDEDLFTILHYDIFGIDPLDVLKISRLAGEKRLTLFDVIASSSLLDSLTLTTRPAVEATLNQLASWSQFDAAHSFVELFEEVLNQSGFLTWVLGQPDSHHRVSRLNSLFTEVKSMNHSDHSLNLSLFLESLRLMEENNLRVEEQNFGQDEHAVTLTTAHSAKGLEWDHVYLYNVQDGVWGNNRVRRLIELPEGLLENVKLDKKEKNEDERRLFYVAATRARLSLTLSHAGGVPSMFISELGDQNLVVVDTKHLESFAHDYAKRLLSSTPPSDTSRKEQAFLQTLADSFTLSATSLNTYLECAYKFKLDKLLKVPHAKKPHLAFGTAVHASLESYYNELKNSGIKPPRAFLLSAFRTALAKEVMSPADFQLRLAQGEKVLSAYYDFREDDFAEPLFLEKFFRVKLDDLTLSGKIDRIDLADSSDRTVRVVDYKTGKYKATDEGLHRQLVFYKLLLDLDRRLQNLSFGEAVLDFVQEPSDKHKDGVRKFQISNDEVGELKKIIKQVMSDIRSLKFPRTTDYKICAKCYFQDHCYPDGIPAFT